VDNQAEDSSKVKTHEEILKLFHEVQSVEAKIKNPEEFKKESCSDSAILQEKKSPLEKSPDTPQTTQHLEPAGEIPENKREKLQKPGAKKIDTPKIPEENKTHWFDFLKLEQHDIQALEPTEKIKSEPEEAQIPQSTFVLELDTTGNLTGFPLKKPPREKKTSPESGEIEEPVTGIRGKLKHLIAQFRRKNPEDSESSGGIGEKLKGVFRRKNKE